MTLLFSCLLAAALHAMLCWSSAQSQVTGFLSIDCGSSATTIYTDANGIEWMGDTNLIKEGTPVLTSGGSDQLLSTMRLFDGNQSKYCYNLTNGAVQAGAFFLIRGSFWAGITPPYTPQNPDGNFRFKLIVDADVWDDVKIPYGTTSWWTYDIYIRAQRSSIDVCLARSTPDGDAPFISTLELRPLPATLTTSILMNFSTGLNLVPLVHADYGVPASSPFLTRWPLDPLDRLWLSYTAAATNALTTEIAINTTGQRDLPPSRILQTTYTGTPYITLRFSNLIPDLKYFAQFYFAEIDQAVNASGQRVFDIYVNGDLLTTDGPIDVFAEVGANTAYDILAVVSPNAAGVLTFNLTANSNSIFLPYLAAAEFFSIQLSTPLTSSSIGSAVENIKTSLDLTSNYAGDPCLPLGFGYAWLNCSGDSRITSISLSNYHTGGEIPESLSTLTMLEQIYLDGNGLLGVIPDLSALTSLQTLDLSNNKLSGHIPQYLATLKNLTVLNLQNNNLTGEIPAALLMRKQASTLSFEFSGNSLCETNSTVTCTP